MIDKNDELLLEKAEALHYTEWYVAFKLAEQAVSPEIKERLERIAKRLYHTEEYYSGML